MGPLTTCGTARLTQASAISNPTLLAGLVRIQPVFNQGKLRAIAFSPAAAGGSTAFAQLGLRSGDLIQAVNGTALDDAGRAMEVLQTLSSSATAHGDRVAQWQLRRRSISIWRTSTLTRYR